MNGASHNVQEGDSRPISAREGAVWSQAIDKAQIGKATLVGRNAAFLLIARIVGLLLWFVLFGTARRTLGSDFNAYSLAVVSIGSVYHLFIDFGFRHLTVREVARNHSMTLQYAFTGFMIRLAIVLPSFALLAIAFNFLYTPAVRVALLIGCAAFVLKSFAVFLTGVFDAHERMHLTALVNTSQAVLIFVVCLPLLYLFREDNIPVLVGDALASLAVMLMAVILVLYIFGRTGSRPRMSGCWSSFKNAAPFGMYFLFGEVCGQAGALLLSTMIGDEEVWGRYLAPMALVLKIELLPKLLASALYPTISKEYEVSLDNASRMYEQAARLIFFFALPVAVGCTVLAPGIINLVYGGGEEEAILLRILAWLIPLRFLGYLLSTTIFAVNKQKTGMYIMGGAAVASIVLNAILIPGFGARGAAIASLGAALIVQGAILWQVCKSLRCSPAPLGSVPCILSCAGMAAVLMLTRHMHLLIAVAVGAVVYSVCLFVFGGIRSSDIRLVRELISRRQLAESGEVK